MNKHARFQELENIIMTAPIDIEAKEQFGDVLNDAVDLLDDFNEGDQILHFHRDGEHERRRIEKLYIRAIWRGRLVEAVEILGATAQNLNVFTRLLNGLRKFERDFYPGLSA